MGNCNRTYSRTATKHNALKTCLVNVCGRHDPRTGKNEIKKWYISCLLPSCHRMLLFCIRMSPMYSYITRILPYVSVNTRMLLVCSRMHSYVTRMCSCDTRMYSYVTRMYSCGVLVVICGIEPHQIFL